MWYTLIAILVIYLLITFGLRAWTRWSLNRNATLLESEAFEQASHNGQIIDLRDAADFKFKHVLGARNIPLQFLLQDNTAIRQDKPVYLVDQDNQGAEKMVRKLKKQGYQDIYVLKGGMAKYTGRTK
ncbi:hypothetical protein IV73_GL001150 [Weissella kandleri]|uniref:Rhodanese domain-containing protein n=1 Tax=Weissella kandleri TaxID=1616 RepID=A0A0R2JFX0_9LACO|nr:rhodanese-like domain-containing protein [Weissella kandleri]KRN74742.1 hypothetical protein IV73_GL001150 [Weissella kandleri]